MRLEDDDDLAGELVRRLAPADAPAGPACPDANALAAFAEGAGPARARAAVEGHLVSCAECRAVLREATAAVADADAEDDAKASSARRAPSLAWAAAFLLALGAGLAGLVVLQGRGARAPADPPATLASAAAALRSARPDLFDGFEPLSAAETAAAAPPRLRGALHVLRPAETVRPGRVTVEWARAPGAVGYEVRVAPAAGGPAWTSSAGDVSSLPYPADAPALEPGSSYVVSVATRGPLGRDEATRRFAVASADEAARLDEGIEEIARQAAPTRHALAAHWALRRGFALEAERLLRARLVEAPDDGAARDLLGYVLRRLGVPEAE